MKEDTRVMHFRHHCHVIFAMYAPNFTDYKEALKFFFKLIRRT